VDGEKLFVQFEEGTLEMGEGIRMCGGKKSRSTRMNTQRRGGDLSCKEKSQVVGGYGICGKKDRK